METIVQEITQAKRCAGENAFLNLRLNGLCILWESQPTDKSDSIDIIGRWELDSSESDQLIELEIVDCAI